MTRRAGYRRAARGAARVVLAAIVPAVAFNLLLAGLDQLVPLRRPPINLDYFLLGIVGGWLSAPMTAAAAFIIFAVDLVTAFLPGFHFSGSGALHALGDLPRLDLGVVLPVIAGILTAFAATHALTAWPVRAVRGRRALTVRSGHLAAIVVLVTCYAAGERAHWMLTSGLFETARMRYGPVEDAPITPARAASSTVTPSPASAGHNILLVVVESWGASNDGRVLDRYAERLRTRAGERYTVTGGRVANFGKTVAAEMRELCGVRHVTVAPALDRLDPATCLPERLNRAGYRTLAVHNFTSAMFRRRRLYEHLGFDRMVFRETLRRRHPGAAMCGTLYDGVCDRSVLDVLPAHLRGNKQFVYWLTLTGHFPPPTARSRPAACAMQPSAATTPRYCNYQFQVERVLDRTARFLATREKPWRAVLVGDHLPHALSRAAEPLYDVRPDQSRGADDENVHA